MPSTSGIAVRRALKRQRCRKAREEAQVLVLFGLTEIHELLLLYTADAQIQTLQTNLQHKHRNIFDKVLTGHKK